MIIVTDKSSKPDTIALEWCGVKQATGDQEKATWTKNATHRAWYVRRTSAVP
jgi:hypothetical protein